jgi:hypothetical protein
MLRARGWWVGDAWLCGALLLAVVLGRGDARAAGPRWVPGSPYFTTTGPAVVWYTNSPLYFTDPGDLSASVDHAAADALVAAAAAVWNVPTSLLVLGQGGELQEHVSGADRGDLRQRWVGDGSSAGAGGERS